MRNQQLQHCHVPDCRIVGGVADASGVCRAFVSHLFPVPPVVHTTQTHDEHVTGIQQHCTILPPYYEIITTPLTFYIYYTQHQIKSFWL